MGIQKGKMHLAAFDTIYECDSQTNSLTHRNHERAQSMIAMHSIVASYREQPTGYNDYHENKDTQVYTKLFFQISSIQHFTEC